MEAGVWGVCVIQGVSTGVYIFIWCFRVESVEPGVWGCV